MNVEQIKALESQLIIIEIKSITKIDQYTCAKILFDIASVRFILRIEDAHNITVTTIKRQTAIAIAAAAVRA